LLTGFVSLVISFFIDFVSSPTLPQLTEVFTAILLLFFMAFDGLHKEISMNLLSLLIAPLQAVVLFFAPHAVGAKPLGIGLGLRLPQRAPALPSHSADTAQLSAHRTPPAQHARITYPRNTPHISAKPIHRVRVVRNVDSSLPADRAGRMVLSGTFADVCAELDRLASAGPRTA
jgi:hypothetical protein